jgi:hypothetical protein
MSIMKSASKLYKLALSFVFLFLFGAAQIANAGHSAGGEVSYIHLGGNMYRIHFTFYRDCQGLSAPALVILMMESTSCGISNAITLSPLPLTGIEIAMPCNGTATTCNGGFNPGFEQWEYETDVAVPAQCPDWTFTFSDCCRIAGTVQPGSAMAVRAHLNNAVSDNNSPQFTNEPMIISCVNKFYHFNNGMTDPDGDSLAYRLIDALGAIYVPPYSGQQPVSSVPPVALDPVTGDYVMNPQVAMISVIAFEIQDFRNGVLMGSVIREISSYAVPCSNEIPTATHMNGTTQQVAYVLPGDTICFDVFSNDLDSGQTVTMTWNQSIPPATFTTSVNQHPTGIFCWTPSIPDVRSQPYSFTVKVQDDNCPANGAGIYSYHIYVTLDTSLVFAGTDDPGSNSLLTVSPNPSGGIFILQSMEKFSMVQVYNQIGACILENYGEQSIDLSEEPAGIYFVKAQDKNGRIAVEKIIKE